MKPPIIIVEVGDIEIFETVEEAEKALESIDVKNNEYVAYDSEGRLLALSIVVEQRPFLSIPFIRYCLKIPVECVKIRPAEVEPQHMDSLRELLLSFLEKLTHHIKLRHHIDDVILKTMSLKDLVDIILTITK